MTGRSATPGFAGLAIGLTLTAVHLIGIPLDGTSVNPARSLGPALFAGGAPLAHVWLFIVAPLIGAALAWPPCGRSHAPGHRGGAGGRGAAGRRRPTGAELPPEEQPAQIPPPATAHDDTGRSAAPSGRAGPGRVARPPAGGPGVPPGRAGHRGT